MYDILIKNGFIIDGTGRAGYAADIGIVNGLIKEVGSLRNVSSREVIDAKGLTVSPGFIDFHSHADVELMRQSPERPKIMQGITTEVIGNCGMAVAPLSKHNLYPQKEYVTSLLGSSEIEWSWSNLKQYFTQLERRNIPVNVASYAAHGAIRVAVMGFDARKPTQEELDKMKMLAVQAMKEGAVGLSTGLIYPPGCYADIHELVELCKVVAEYDGFYASHVRNESDKLIESLKEAIEIGKRANISVHISHFKISGRSNWSKIGQALDLIHQAKREGIDITCDQYPYTAGSTTLTALLPQWVLAGGLEASLRRLSNARTRRRIRRELHQDIPRWNNLAKTTGWDNIVISLVNTEKNKILEGKSIAKIAELREKDPADVLFDLLTEEKGSVIMVVFQGSEENVRRILQEPTTMIGTDGIPRKGKPHPRLYGTFPRILGKYVREENILSLEEAIHRMTFLPAKRLQFDNIGQIKKGNYADITIFDRDSITDKSTYDQPCQYPEGIEYVLVSGEISVKTGEYTGALPGRILRKPSSDRNS